MALDARRLRARDLAMSRRAPTRYAVAASALPSTPTATRRVGRTIGLGAAESVASSELDFPCVGRVH